MVSCSESPRHYPQDDHFKSLSTSHINLVSCILFDDEIEVMTKGETNLGLMREARIVPAPNFLSAQIRQGPLPKCVRTWVR